MEIELQGERLLLLAQRALYQPRRRTLFIADPHFGKADAFRAASVPVPNGSTAGTLARLDEALSRNDCERLVILGDFWHAPIGCSPQVIDEITCWRDRHSSLQIDLILGNHDRRVNAPPAEWRFQVHPDRLIDPPFVFAHHPVSDERGYVLAGHLHPGIRLEGRGRQRLRLPCFWFGERVGVLPAFGEFTGLADVQPRTGDRVFAVAEGDVVALPVGFGN